MRAVVRGSRSLEQLKNEDNIEEFPNQTKFTEVIISNDSKNQRENFRTSKNDGFEHREVKKHGLTQNGGKSTFLPKESGDVDIVIKNLENSQSSGRTTPAVEIPSELDKYGNNGNHSLTTNPIVTSLLSVLSTMTLAASVSDVENSFEDSLEQKKQMLLAMQR